MPKQICFPGLKPPVPTMRTIRVVVAIARRIVEIVNLDDFYWESSEIPERITDVAAEIMRCGRPLSVFQRLHHQQPPISDSGERGGHPYGWDGIDDHCRAIADDIAREEVEKAVAQHKLIYG